MAYYLCLRASEYVSKTKIPDPESHQFDSKSVEFKCFTDGNLVFSSSMHGVPIWFSTKEDNSDAIAFLQLVYLWSRMSKRLPNDPFLSYQSDTGALRCLVYATVHDAIAQ